MATFYFIRSCWRIVAHPVRAQDFWGRKLPDQPTDFIFGYGSLINTASRNSSLVQPVPTIPVRVSAAFGYVRTWNDRAPSGFTALGLRKPVSGESPMTINGVLYPVEGTDMTSLDTREQGYVRVEIPHADMEAVSWQSLPAKGRIWVYVLDVAGKQPGVDLPSPDAQYPILSPISMSLSRALWNTVLSLPASFSLPRNRSRADEEHAKRREDYQQQVRADHDEVFKYMRDHLDRLRNGGK